MTSWQESINSLLSCLSALCSCYHKGNHYLGVQSYLMFLVGGVVEAGLGCRGEGSRTDFLHDFTHSTILQTAALIESRFSYGGGSVSIGILSYWNPTVLIDIGKASCLLLWNPDGEPCRIHIPSVHLLFLVEVLYIIQTSARDAADLRSCGTDLPPSYYSTSDSEGRCSLIEVKHALYRTFLILPSTFVHFFSHSEMEERPIGVQCWN